MDWNNHTAIEVIRMICVFYALICSLTFIFPLTYLLYVQTTNCLTDQTTFERFGYQNSKTSSISKTVSAKTEVIILIDRV